MYVVTILERSLPDAHAAGILEDGLTIESHVAGGGIEPPSAEIHCQGSITQSVPLLYRWKPV